MICQTGAQQDYGPPVGPVPVSGVTVTKADELGMTRLQRLYNLLYPSPYAALCVWVGLPAPANILRSDR